MFRFGAEVEKACAIQSWRRTAARASEKVRASLAYYAARLGRTRPRAARSLAQSVTFLDVRTAVLNDMLEGAFRRRRSDFRPINDDQVVPAAA